MIRHNRAYLLSQKILYELGIDAFPINVFLAAKQACPLPIVFMTLGEYRNRIRIQDDLLVKDALCICRPGRGYLILYNEKQSKKRIRFSIAHELGHIMLGLRTAAPRFPARGLTILHISTWRERRTPLPGTSWPRPF